MQLTPKKMKWFLRFYPPYIGAGIKVNLISADWMTLKVSMSLKWYNKNAVGTQFGGSLYSMTDPHYVLMLMNLLGREFIVWDKSGSIDFIKPGKGKVSATFTITNEMINEIKLKTAGGEKYLPEFEVDIIDDNDDIIAKVYKTLYIRRKQP